MSRVAAVALRKRSLLRRTKPTKTIKVDYLARVEGEGSLYLKIRDGEVEEAVCLPPASTLRRLDREAHTTSFNELVADHGWEKLGEKIRRAITQKVGSLLVVGDDDVEAHDEE